MTADIVKLQQDLVSAPKYANVQVNDAGVGESDVREEMWVASRDVEAIINSSKEKEKRISELQEQCFDLQASLGTKERLLAALQEKENS